MINRRTFYQITTDSGETNLAVRGTLSAAKKCRIKYAVKYKLPRWKIGIEQLCWDKDMRMWESVEIC